jgi:hypothetical protein
MLEINLSTALLVRRNDRIRERLIPVAKIHLQESQAPGPSARLLFYRLRYFGAEYHGKHRETGLALNGMRVCHI